MITVSVCCNDPDNGNFDGRVAGIEIHGAQSCDISLEPDTYPSPRFAWLDKPPEQTADLCGVDGMNKTDRAMIEAQREREELGMGNPPPGYKALEQIADVVLSYRPKSKQPKPKKRKKAKRGKANA